VLLVVLSREMIFTSDEEKKAQKIPNKQNRLLPVHAVHAFHKKCLFQKSEKIVLSLLSLSLSFTSFDTHAEYTHALIFSR
jgi:hypothetical protein